MNCVNDVTCVNGFVRILRIVWLAGKIPQYIASNKAQTHVICVSCVNAFELSEPQTSLPPKLMAHTKPVFFQFKSWPEMTISRNHWGACHK
jgi:hypothetical protein